MAEDKANWKFDPITGAPISAAEVSCSDGRGAGVPTAVVTASGSSGATFCDLPTATVFSGGAGGDAGSGTGEAGAPVAIAMPHRSAILPGSGDRNLLPLHGVG